AIGVPGLGEGEVGVLGVVDGGVGGEAEDLEVGLAVDRFGLLLDLEATAGGGRTRGRGDGRGRTRRRRRGRTRRRRRRRGRGRGRRGGGGRRRSSRCGRGRRRLRPGGCGRRRRRSRGQHVDLLREQQRVDQQPRRAAVAGARRDRGPGGHRLGAHAIDE